MNKNIYLKLKKLSKNSYGNYCGNEAAIIITNSGKEYQGVSVYIDAIPLYTSAICNAISNAVSSGEKEFVKLIVYIDSSSNSIYKGLVDDETKNMMKEFCINSYDLFCDGEDFKHISVGDINEE